MSRIITNDYYIALECKDLQANAMSVDCSGTYALLAGRKCIALRNLDEEYDNLFKVPKSSKYDVSAVEWNPTNLNKEVFALATNERLEILNWREETLSVLYSLRAHTRAISDLNWHRFDSNILATSSMDTFVNAWDLRDPKKPILSLQNVAESSQVKWNKVSPHLFATAHDGDIKIWDFREASNPLQYISAHLAKIYGLDWSPYTENQITSASQDHSVRFFDTTNPRKPESVLNTGSPVWRARYTPFGNGLVTVVVPQLRRGAENSLLMWNLANKSAPMHTFVGHRDVVLEFQWRTSKSDSNFQLVTWAKDQTLLVWKIDPLLPKLCGNESDNVSIYDNSSSIDAIDATSTTSSKKNAGIQPLQQEFSLMNVQIPNLEVKTMDSVNRVVTATLRVNSFIVNVQVTFPNTYPHAIPPAFQIMPGSNINDSIGLQLLQTLNHLAQQRVSRNRTCLEPCLRQMVVTLELLSANMESDRTFERMYTDSPMPSAVYNDAYIPFPRTSGAKFCAVNTLVCFGRPHLIRRVGNRTETGTPRALSALEGNLAKRSNDQMTVSAYYFQKQKARSRSKHPLSKASKAMVHLYDASNLFLINRQLAEEYILNGNVTTICKHNAAAAAVVGRRDLVQAWTIAELTLAQRQTNGVGVWPSHPCGDNLLTSLIKHYASQADIQMAAMLCCVFVNYQRSMGHKTLKYPGSTTCISESIPSRTAVNDNWVLPISSRAGFSSVDNLKMEEIVTHEAIFRKIIYVALYEHYKMAYAETLQRWRLLYNRAEVMKFMAVQSEPYEVYECIPECQFCQASIESSVCTNCKKRPFNCLVCNIAVKGSMNYCIICGHGGHTDHMEEWFLNKELCPLCGCHCLYKYGVEV